MDYFVCSSANNNDHKCLLRHNQDLSSRRTKDAVQKFVGRLKTKSSLFNMNTGARHCSSELDYELSNQNVVQLKTITWSYVHLMADVGASRSILIAICPHEMLIIFCITQLRLLTTYNIFHWDELLEWLWLWKMHK